MAITYLESIVVGALQGVSELFPVSSLGHSILLPAWIGGQWATDLDMSAKDSPYLALLVAMHVATALALVIFFRRDWVRILTGLWDAVRMREIRTPEARLGVLLGHCHHRGRLGRTAAREGRPQLSRHTYTDLGVPGGQRIRAAVG